MITLIRKSFKNNIYRIVLWITLLALAGLFSIPQLFKNSSGPGSWVTSVNGYDVSYEDFMRRSAVCEQRIRMIREQYGPAADGLLERLGSAKTQAMDSLVNEQLILQVAKKLNIQVDPDYTSRKLNDAYFVYGQLSDVIPASIINPGQGFNQQALHRYLRQQALTTEEFEQLLENQMRKYITTQLLEGALYIPEFELRSYYMTMQPRSFSVLAFSKEALLAEEKKAVLTEEELQRFFTKHGSAYEVAESRTGTCTVFDPSMYGITVTDKEIESYYNTHKRTQFLSEPASVQVRRIVVADSSPAGFNKAEKLHLQLLKNPASFAQVAQESSDDKDSAKSGGLMPWFKRGEKAAAYEKAAFVLQEDGAISAVTPTPEGFQILQRIGKKMPVYKELAAVKNDIRKILINQQFNDQFARDMKRIMLDKSGLAEFVRAKSATSTHVSVQNDGSKRAQAFFRTKAGDVAFYQEDGKGYLVEMQEVKKAHIPALSSLKATVMHDIYLEKAGKKMIQLLKDARAKALVSPMTEVKNMFKAELTSTGMVNGLDEKMIQKLHDQGLPLSRMMVLEKTGSLVSFENETHGYIIRLDTIAPFNEQDYKTQKNALKYELAQAKRSMITGGFVASLYRNATIKSNELLSTTSEDYSI